MTDNAQLLRQVRLAMKQHNYAEAIECLKQAAANCRRESDQAGEGRHLGNIAVIYNRLGRPEQAFRYFDKALTIARAEADRLTESGLLGNMGNIMREIGRNDYAVAYLNQALQIAQEVGDIRGQGNWLNTLGLVYDDLRQYARAIECFLQTVDIARDLRDQRGLATRLDNLANSYVSYGDYASALFYYHEAANMYRDMSLWNLLTQRLRVMGYLYGELAKRAEEMRDAHVFFAVSLEYYQQALMLAHDQLDRQSQADVLRSMGNLLISMGEYEQAIYRLVPASHHYAYLQLHEDLAEVQDSLAYAQAHRQNGHQR